MEMEGLAIWTRKVHGAEAAYSCEFSVQSPSEGLRFSWLRRPYFFPSTLSTSPQTAHVEGLNLRLGNPEDKAVTTASGNEENYQSEVVTEAGA